MADVGREEGETCGRDGCDGVIEIQAVVDCSCHINPPCGACLDARPHCPKCGWEAPDEDA